MSHGAPGKANTEGFSMNYSLRNSSLFAGKTQGMARRRLARQKARYRYGTDASCGLPSPVGAML